MKQIDTRRMNISGTIKSAKRYRDDDLRDDMLETKRAKYASDEQIRIKKREQSRNNRRASR